MRFQFVRSNRFYVVLLGFGGLLLLMHFLFPFSPQTQLWLFSVGIIVLGLPHGSVDVLISSQSATLSHHRFSLPAFLFRYLLRIAAFALLFYLFPGFALCIFILLAAFHFGETDLKQFDTRSGAGQWLALSYGLLIVTTILVLHLEEVQPILSIMGIEAAKLQLLGWLGDRKLLVLSAVLLLFFSSTFFYCLTHRRQTLPSGTFLLHLLVLFPLLYCLPLLIGFTFYFVVWHSMLSLTDILYYLHARGRQPLVSVSRHMLLYSGLALGGLLLLGYCGRLLINQETLLVLFLLALALLTTPHMKVMHEMYRHLRR